MAHKLGTYSNATGHFTQLRDAYADIYFDHDKEFRVRAGQSKVPYGFTNMQSSQNRLTLDRPDALNTATRDERDLGLYFYYTPKEMRHLFRDLVKNNLKGSGDYGMFAFGVYNGKAPIASNSIRICISFLASLTLMSSKVARSLKPRSRATPDGSCLTRLVSARHLAWRRIGREQCRLLQ